MPSTLRLWAVRSLDGERVIVVPARSGLAARTRLSESAKVPLSTLVAEPELEPVPRRHFRCGAVGIDVLWSHRERRYHVGVAWLGNTRYLIGVAVGMDEARRARESARLAIQDLRDREDMDDTLLLWEPGTERLHVVEAKQAVPASIFTRHKER